MAHRNFTQFHYALERMPVELYAQVAIGATGTPTLSVANSKGIASMVRNSTGNYTITLQDGYNRLMLADCLIQNATGIPAGVSMGLVTTGSDVTTSGGGTLKVQFSTGGSATELASGDTLYLNIVLSNSSL
jgi:hypothetical protein